MALFRRRRADDERAVNPYSLNQWIADYFSYQGNAYPLFTMGNAMGNEESPGGFEGYVQAAYRSNGVVFACMVARQMVFSDVRFQFRRVSGGTPGELFGVADGRNPASSGLRMLRRPWQGGTTGDLLARMIQDADLAGNAFVARLGGQLARLRPDWVTIVASLPAGATTLWHPEARVDGYVYKPGGPETDDAPIAFLAEDVAHFAPVPDPLLRFRGVSWLDSVWREVMADKSATSHKQAFFDNGATVNLVLEYPPETKKEIFDLAVRTFKEGHEGAANAYRALHLYGATAKPIGVNMVDADLKALQGSSETRIAAAAGVPPVIVGLSEGLQGSSLNAGNYSSARRSFADRTIRPLWRNVCGSLENIIATPPDAELWYDDSDVAFIREDQKDAAEIRQIDATTISSLVDAGFSPASAADAVVSGDFSRLRHTGLVSVQLQKPGESNGNGNGNGAVPKMVPAMED